MALMAYATNHLTGMILQVVMYHVSFSHTSPDLVEEVTFMGM